MKVLIQTGECQQLTIRSVEKEPAKQVAMVQDHSIKQLTLLVKQLMKQQPMNSIDKRLLTYMASHKWLSLSKVQGMRDMMVTAWTEIFATPRGKDGVVTHWNPCDDTTIKDLKCYTLGQLFETSDKAMSCETLAGRRDSYFSVEDDELVLNYRNYKDGVDIHIAMNCSKSTYYSYPFTRTDKCSDPSGYCYSFTHPDACLHPIDSDIIVSGAASYYGTWKALVSAFAMLWLTLQMM
ncbi:uncharacterized protein [Watersipora subatra]|uniref:uncharacterized protein n=1 Tax=Watersipora subatra TaxID=2589382 RepID=UPI00355C90BC